MISEKTGMLAERFGAQFAQRPHTIGELIEMAETMDAPLSSAVLAEATVREGKGLEEIMEETMAGFGHNFDALEIGLTKGQSFLLGTVGSDLAGSGSGELIADPLINAALTYTLAAEVGNHEVGLRPCAGTGDSCPYTGLLRALLESDYTREEVLLAAILILKVGSIFRVGKRTTGCNMEGYGAGAAATAAALTELRGGSAKQVGKAIVLAISPTIGVPCTPRVMVSGLCATHIGGAILVGNLAAGLVLNTSLPVDVDVDVMMAMAARVHIEAAPVITDINLTYMRPYFKSKAKVESWVDEEIKEQEQNESSTVHETSRAELIQMMTGSRPLTQTLGDVVVGGSSIAVGSPTNMARICHEMAKGDITAIEIDLTVDLFSRRGINVPAILMAAVFGARTDDAASYKEILDRPELDDIDIRINRVAEPEIQRLRIRAAEGDAMLDSRNRGGGRVAIVAAEPSMEEALKAAEKLNIQVTQ